MFKNIFPNKSIDIEKKQHGVNKARIHNLLIGIEIQNVPLKKKKIVYKVLDINIQY